MRWMISRPDRPELDRVVHGLSENEAWNDYIRKVKTPDPRSLFVIRPIPFEREQEPVLPPRSTTRRTSPISGFAADIIDMTPWVRTEEFVTAAKELRDAVKWDDGQLVRDLLVKHYHVITGALDTAARSRGRTESPPIDSPNVLSMAACLMASIDRMTWEEARDKLALESSNLLREKWFPIATTALEHFNFIPRPKGE